MCQLTYQLIYPNPKNISELGQSLQGWVFVGAGFDLDQGTVGYAGLLG